MDANTCTEMPLQAGAHRTDLRHHFDSGAAAATRRSHPTPFVSIPQTSGSRLPASLDLTQIDQGLGSAPPPVMRASTARVRRCLWAPRSPDARDVRRSCLYLSSNHKPLSARQMCLA